MPSLCRNGSRFVIQSGPVSLEVDPLLGGRITGYSYEGRNILAGPDRHADYWGSTFWLSPEDVWKSPEPSLHDRGAYRVVSGEELPLVIETSEPSVVDGRAVEVRKKFDVSGAGSLSISYGVRNVGREAIQVAPWEVTRLPGGGISLFPYGRTERVTEGLELEIVDGVAFFDHARHADEGGQKLWADGREGWCAHYANGLLHVKRFEDLNPAETAPGEGDVEIYSSNSANDPKAYIELECQGRYFTLASGEETRWSVEWWLERVDEATSWGDRVNQARRLCERP